MIRPDMATMLAFVATDAVAEPGVLQQALTDAVAVSFNRITVDGDTSTNDACTLIATGAADMPPLDLHGPAYRQFVELLTDVLLQLAQTIIRDAEGATKFITINVIGGTSEADNLSVAYTVAESPLVKTAMFASDPNWGRILAAVGRAPVANLDIADVDISINATPIITAGQPANGYSEAAGQAAMAGSDIVVDIRIGGTDDRVTVWTSDLSHEYVRINAEYRT
jgi:glutamate N-acetyltransferase/amino-acid N-acetyltransferase